MSRQKLIEEIESSQLKKNLPEFRVGDTLKVQIKIVEGNKERLQSITGTVIAKRGNGLSETFAIYRVAYGAAMERVFPLHSPRIANIEMVREGKVRRSKLYYLRGVSGKKAKVKEQLVSKRKTLIVEDSQPFNEAGREETTN